jgi:hypothetical protein
VTAEVSAKILARAAERGRVYGGTGNDLSVFVVRGAFLGTGQIGCDVVLVVVERGRRGVLCLFC